MLPNWDTERSKAKCVCGEGGSNIVHVSASHHTCSPLDVTFMWINIFPFSTRFLSQGTEILLIDTVGKLKQISSLEIARAGMECSRHGEVEWRSKMFCWLTAALAQVAAHLWASVSSSVVKWAGNNIIYLCLILLWLYFRAAYRY